MIDLRWRVLAFLTVLFLDAALVKQQPLSMGIGIAAYLLILFPALRRRNDRP